MTRASEIARQADGRLLTGHVGVWGELLGTLADRRGLTVVSADPWSGSSRLVGEALDVLGLEGGHGVEPLASIVIDARRCGSGFDLAMAVSDAAVERFAPESLEWWLGYAPPASTRGLALHRALDAAAVDVSALRTGKPRVVDRLPHAMTMLATMADGPCTVFVDHLGRMLASTREGEAREMLSLLRTARQAHPSIDLVLLDQPDGVILEALQDPGHPLYRAGEVLRIPRPAPEMFANDLIITRPLIAERVDLVRAAAELSAGVPALLWRIVDLSPGEGDGVARAVAGWKRLADLSEPWLAHQWDLLRRAHPAAQALVGALGRGAPANSVPAASKSVDDGLKRLRGLGVAWQPKPLRWALTDPLLGEYAARRQQPPWVRRQSRAQFKRTRSNA